MLQDRPRFALLSGPTPIERLARLEHVLAGDAAPPLFVKRDDIMGVGGGGNKLRKLEFLIADAQAQGCDTFVTTGGRQSNHARLSAAASARAGLACELVLADLVDRDDESYRRNGNILLDGLFGARLHHVTGDTDTLAFARARAEDLRAEGRKAYVVGAGGSSPIGCLGYAACAHEILAQEAALGLRFERIVIPNGSAGTHAGLAAGFAAAGEDPRRVQSYTVLAPLAQAQAATRDLARETLKLLDPDAALADDDILVLGGQRGEGYGIPTAAMLEAVRLVARAEGLLLDPVYGGKAFAGLIAAIRSGEARGPSLFVMTGGVPGLFAYEPAFRDEDRGPRQDASASRDAASQ